jgi:SpoVK/Ycf46/Vps4 family AAA+-type ATPase
MTRPSSRARRSYKEPSDDDDDDDDEMENDVMERQPGNSMMMPKKDDDVEDDDEHDDEHDDDEHGNERDGGRRQSKRARRSAGSGNSPAFGTKLVKREKRRSTRNENKPRKRYVDDDAEDSDDFIVDDDGEDDDDEDDEVMSDDFIEDESDEEPVRRSTRARATVNRLSPTFNQRNDDGDEDELDDEEEETDEEDIGVNNRSYPQRERGPPPERFAPPEEAARNEAGESGRGLFSRGGNAWKDDRKKGGRASRERSRRQTSGRWIDDSEDSDDGEFKLGAGALDAFKAPPAYPLAGANGASTAAPNGPDVNAEITPVTVDPTLSFSSVGGLDKYVDALKEMVFLPLLYPEVFARFKMTPPRGVLLYGAPGTGKTLIARALAASCSRAGSEVAFFMRKGADVLSKWVGESERQLRLLFEEAQKRQPAIIFFDELDGLAPVRSSKTDQIHNSLVATLLALMDGLDSRGRVVVLGATNRVDSIDGALRRPGRFDRELAFPLPGVRARGEILKIHTRAWEQQPSQALIDDLAAKCVGYCGADLKALCTEAAVHALRRRYPQIYESDERLNIDPKQVIPNRTDFRAALAAIVPASHRAARTHAKPLSALQKPLLESVLEKCLESIRQTFPPAAFISLDGDGEAVGVNSGARQITDSIDEDEDEEILDAAKGDDGALPAESSTTAALEFMRRPPCQRTALCLHGLETSGYTQLTSALLHCLEQFPVHAIGMPSLLGDSGRSPEEALVTAITEARRAAPSILYLPEIRLWWESSTPTLRAALTTLLRDIPTDLPVMLITTADVADVEELDEGLRACFASVRWKPIAMPKTYAAKDIENFYRPLCDAAFNIAHRKDLAAERGEDVGGVTASARKREVLARAPRSIGVGATRNSQQKVSQATLAAENHSLRQQRMFLRDVVTRLLYKKQWSLFAAPITNDDLHAYRDRVTEPMDLSTLLWKVDGEKYLTVDAFLEDSHLITKSAHEYWGEQTDDADGRIMLSKAHALEDTIAQMVSALDPQLVVRCQEIAKARGTRSQQGQGAMKEQNIESDSAGNERPSRSGGELVAPKGAPVWQNADFVKDPEALARQMKKKAREEAAAAASDEPEPTPMEEEEAPTTPIVADADASAKKKVGPPATSDEKLAKIKTSALSALVSNALSAKFDFGLLENSASEMSRDAKRAMEDASGRGVLCVAALAAAIGSST